MKYTTQEKVNQMKQNPLERGKDREDSSDPDQSFESSPRLFFCQQVISVWPAAHHSVRISSASCFQLLLQQSKPGAKISFRQICLFGFVAVCGCNKAESATGAYSLITELWAQQHEDWKPDLTTGWNRHILNETRAEMIKPDKGIKQSSCSGHHRDNCGVTRRECKHVYMAPGKSVYPSAWFIKIHLNTCETLTHTQKTL